MRPVKYERAAAIDDALTLGRSADSAYYAGGTLLVDLMKLDVMQPRTVVDINHLPLAVCEERSDGWRLGALARMSDVAGDVPFATAFPAVAQALAASASGQLRNMASLGGNILQRTRCPYYRDVATACNKREPGSGCSAISGINAEHAVLGTSADCIAVSPSDFAVTLAAFDAVVNVRGTAGERAIAIRDFFLLPGRTPDREFALEPGELVTSIDLPATPAAANAVYVKIRDRASYAYALVSVAAGVERAADGRIADVRVALGGVGTVPWRATRAEETLRGQAPSRERFAAAARAVFADAAPTMQNRYKIDIAVRSIVHALETVCA